MMLSHCAEQVRGFDNDRFLCSLFAPSRVREALWSLYAFNLEVARIREQVREPLLGHIRLRWWRDALDAVYAGKPAPKHPVAEPLAATITTFELDRALFDRLLDGRARDLDDAAPASLATLVDYADATSASLSVLALRILGAHGTAAELAARDVGIAWALQGLARAVPFHAQRRRLYLPAELNREAGLDAFALFDHGPQPALASVVEKVAKTAADHLGRARGMRHDVPATALPALLPGALAQYYLEKLARSGFDPFDERVRRAGAGRLLTLISHRLRGRF